MVLSPALCVFFTIGMAPAMVSYFVDMQPGKNYSSTIAFFNMTGITIPGMQFLHGDRALSFATALDMRVLILVYLFAAMGYFIVWLIPKITVIVVDYKNERRAIRIREKVSALVEEWGPEVRRN